MTIKELRNLCEEEIRNGKADNEIVICVNVDYTDEFYTLNTGFSSPVYNDSAVYNIIEKLGIDENAVSVLN